LRLAPEPIFERVVSPLLANLYLDPLDHLVEGAGGRTVRYADGFVILCRGREEAEGMPALAAAWMAQSGLRLHPDKTVVVDMREPGGFDFLGYRFTWGRREPRKKSMKKFKIRGHVATCPYRRLRRFRGRRRLSILDCGLAPSGRLRRGRAGTRRSQGGRRKGEVRRVKKGNSQSVILQIRPKIAVR
jgi:hypothetical protein